MSNIINKLSLLAALLLISACSTTFRSNVATFHELTDVGGKSLVITTIDADKRDSLEFKAYANALAKYLTKHGYIHAGDAEPQLIAGFDLTVNDGREKLRDRSHHYAHRFWDSYWPWGRYWGYDPMYGHPFHDLNHQIVSSTVYTATLTLELRKPNGDMVFEGRADAEIRHKTLPEVMPFLAEALFENFPGESGVTRRVILKPETDK